MSSPANTDRRPVELLPAAALLLAVLLSMLPRTTGPGTFSSDPARMLPTLMTEVSP